MNEMIVYILQQPEKQYYIILTIHPIYALLINENECFDIYDYDPDYDYNSTLIFFFL